MCSITNNCLIFYASSYKSSKFQYFFGGQVRQGTHVYLKGDVRERTRTWGDGEVDWLRFDDAVTNVLEGEQLVVARHVATLSTDLQDKVRALAVGKKTDV